MNIITALNTPDTSVNNPLFEKIAQELSEKGYSIQPNALPADLAASLLSNIKTMPGEKFKRAGIGRDKLHVVNKFVRTDEICWITGDSDAGQQWLDWTNLLKEELNRRLFLGLFSFESHFAHYAPNDYYKKHLDAFKGEANRVLSMVVYLNPGWLPEDGGELVIYTADQEDENGSNKPTDVIKVTPAYATLVAFLSEEFPHEVLPAKRDRYSIAGWYRLNTSSTDKVDPPS